MSALPKRVLITGSSGAIGSRVANQAVRAGYRVRCMVRPSSQRESLADLDAEICEADLRDPDSLRAAVRDVDVVVHTAAQLGDWCSEETSRAVNVDGVRHLVGAAQEQGGLQRFVHVSSLGVYQAQDHFGTDETTPPNFSGIDAYTRTKAEAETILTGAHQQSGFPCVILRPGFIYGPGERHVVPRVVENIVSGRMKIIGNGDKVLNNTFVGNIADAILLAIENDQAVGETFNIRDNRLVNRVEFIGTISEYLQQPMPGRVPYWLAKAAVPVFEAIGRLANMQSAPVLTKTRMKFMTLNLDFSIDKAKRILGYQPRIDFQEGIRDALDWLASRNLLPNVKKNR